MPGKQVRNGRAFEYAIAKTYQDGLRNRGVDTQALQDENWEICHQAYSECGSAEQEAFSRAAGKTLETLCRLEPGLTRSAFCGDVLKLKLMPTAAGIHGDVRDIVFWHEQNAKTTWEIGISAKNNHEAVKHPRISPNIDFGQEWLGIPCSPRYLKRVGEIFQVVADARQNNYSTWEALGEQYKFERVYQPLLKAFQTELMNLCSNHQENVVVRKLLEYLVGRYPFYKIIKHDQKGIVVVKAFNFLEGMGKPYGGTRPDVVPDRIRLPSRVIEMQLSSRDSSVLVLDEGWQLKFRVHNADKKLGNSVKFDVQMIGNPPVLFSQYLFVD